MTANDPTRQQEAANHWAKAMVRARDQGTVDFDVFDQRERALLYKKEERPKSGLITPSRCKGSHSSSLQERLFRHSISTHQMIGQHAQTVVSPSRNHPCGLRHRQWPVFVAGLAVLLFASGLAMYSLNFACQLLETL